MIHDHWKAITMISTTSSYDHERVNDNEHDYDHDHEDYHDTDHDRNRIGT